MCRFAYLNVWVNKCLWEYKNVLWDYCICEFIVMCECVRACGSICTCICLNVCMCEWGYVYAWIYMECVGACENIEGTMCVWVCCAHDHVWMCTHAPCLRGVSPVTSWLNPLRGDINSKTTQPARSPPPHDVFSVGSRIPARSQSHHRGDLMNDSSIDDCKELWSPIWPS